MREEFVYFPPTDRNKHFSIELAGISYCDETYRIRRDKSACMCLEYVIAGRGTIILDGKKYEAKAGDVYLLPEGHDQFYFSDKQDPWEKIWFNATGTLPETLFREYNPGNLVVFENAGGREYIEKIHEIGRNSEYTVEEKHRRAAIVLHELMQFLYEEFYGRKMLISEEVRQMKGYLEEHISRNVSLKELGDLVFLSESQVVRCFKKDLDVTPHEYSLSLKLEQAKKLLGNTRLLVKEIADYLGFCDEHYFSYIFKRKVGKTPLEYRNREDKSTLFEKEIICTSGRSYFNMRETTE